MNKVEALQACESTYHECSLQVEVKNYKEGIIVEKVELIMKKDKKNKEIMTKKT